MFRPNFLFVEQHSVRVEGFSRRFGQPSTRNWGRPEHPAPTCSLIPGGAVDGVVFGVSDHHKEAVLRELRRREAQDPIELHVSIDGDEVTALTWTMNNPWAERSIEALVSAAVANVSHGGGPFGNAWDYVDGVKCALEQRGLYDPFVHEYHTALFEALEGKG